MNIKFKKIICSLLVAALAIPSGALAQRADREDDEDPPATEETQPGPKVRGSQGANFEVLPVRCTNTILYGKDGKYKNVSFVLPRIFGGLDVNGEPLISVVPMGNDEFRLKVGLYFQFGEEGLRRRQNDSATANLKGCDIGEVVADYNFGKVKSEQIKSPVPLKITKVLGTLEGYDLTARYGSDVSEMSEYEGFDPVLVFRVKGEEKMTTILNELRSTMGLPLNLQISFGASAPDGFLKMTINYSQVAKSLQASTSQKGHQIVDEATLRTNLESAAKNSSREVSMQLGSNSAFNEMVTKIVAESFADINAAAQADREMRAEHSRATDEILAEEVRQKGELELRRLEIEAEKLSKEENDQIREMQDKIAELEKLIQESKGGGGAEPNAVQALTQKLGVPNPLTKPVFKLSGVLGYLKKTEKHEISIKNQSAEDEHSYFVQTNLRAKASQPGTAEIRFSPGVNNKKQFNLNLKKGAVITAKLTGHETETFEYTSGARFFTVDEITDPKRDLKSYFTELGRLEQYPLYPCKDEQHRAIVENANESWKDWAASFFLNKDKRSERVCRGYVYKSSWSLNYASYVRYYYGQTYPVFEEIKVQKKATPKFTVDGAKDVPLQFTFSNLGITRSFTFEDIVDASKQYKDLWTTQIDPSGEMTFMANQDLGTVYIENTDTPKTVRAHYEELMGKVRDGRTKQAQIDKLMAEMKDALSTKAFFRQRYSSLTKDEEPDPNVCKDYNAYDPNFKGTKTGTLPCRVVADKSRKYDEDRILERQVFKVKFHYKGVRGQINDPLTALPLSLEPEGILGKIKLLEPTMR